MESVVDSCFKKLCQNIDIVFDTVGEPALARSCDVLSPRGRMLTIAASEESTADARAKQAFFVVEPNREQLATIGGMLNEQQRPERPNKIGCRELLFEEGTNNDAQRNRILPDDARFEGAGIARAIEAA